MRRSQPILILKYSFITQFVPRPHQSLSKKINNQNHSNERMKFISAVCMSLSPPPSEPFLSWFGDHKKDFIGTSVFRVSCVRKLIISVEKKRIHPKIHYQLPYAMTRAIHPARGRSMSYFDLWLKSCGDFKVVLVVGCSNRDSEAF